MPSIIPSYVYTLFASIIVGTLVISSCGLIVVNVKAEAEIQQLKNIANYVATKSLNLISYSNTDNVKMNLQLDIPSLIGGQRYWILIHNDSSGSWVEAGFGATPTSSIQRAHIPFEGSSSGSYVSGSGPVFMQYQSNSTGLYLILNGDD